MTITKSDGRHQRAARTRAALLEACRILMRRGLYRPDMKAVAKASGFCTRSGFQHFTCVENLWREALEDWETFTALVDYAIGEENRRYLDQSPILQKIIKACVLHERHAGN